MSVPEPAGVAELHAIYAKYVKPVEQDHLDEYVVVLPDGKLYFARSLDERLAKTDQVPNGGALFKVGPIAACNIL